MISSEILANKFRGNLSVQDAHRPQHNSHKLIRALGSEFCREQQTITNRLQTEYDILQERVWVIRKQLSEDSTRDKEWHILKDELDRVETRRIRIEEQMRTGELE